MENTFESIAKTLKQHFDYDLKQKKRYSDLLSNENQQTKFRVVLNNLGFVITVKGNDFSSHHYNLINKTLKYMHENLNVSIDEILDECDRIIYKLDQQ